MSKTINAVIDAYDRCKIDLGHEELSIVASRPESKTDRLAAADVDVENAVDEGEIEPIDRIELHFVKCVDPSKCEGRTVRIDNQNRVVWSPPTMFGKPVPVKTYKPPEYDVLVSAVGARCLRQRDALRDKLPDTMIRFVEFVRMLASLINEDSGARGEVIQ